MHNKQLFKVVAMVAVIGGVGVLQAQEPQHPKPEVSDVTMKQVAYSSKVEISYKLTGAAAIVTLAIETNGVAIPDSVVTRLEGDVSVVVQPDEETKSITWNAGADWPDNMTDKAVARVTAWTLDCPPAVMVVDLGKGTAASAGDQYPVKYYPSTDALLDGVENTIYKNEYLVLKKIKKGSFTMGEDTGTKNVKLTEDFYIGVYQLTQGQWANIAGTDRKANFMEISSRAFRPMENVSYCEIRENINNTANAEYKWPDKGSAVHPDSFMGKLRAYTGNRILFDLPTEAQWEYACRAGTTTYYSDGIPGTPNTTSNAQIDVLGRYSRNGGQVSTNGGATWANASYSSGSDFGTAIVGSYLPNPWGLYDMHGNLYEWCLDWYMASVVGGTDPVGPVEPGTSIERVVRGGWWGAVASGSRSSNRWYRAPANRTIYDGFRVAAAAVVSQQ